MLIRVIRALHFLRHQYGFAQGAKLIVYFLQFVLRIALGYDAATSLEPQFAVSRYKCADGDGLIQTAIQSDVADATAVCTAVMWLVFADELHGAYLGCT